MAVSAAILLAVEIGAAEFERSFRDEQGQWLGADLVLLTRDPVEELADTPVILETVTSVQSRALHVKVSDKARHGAWLGEDTARALGVRLGDQFTFGSARLRYMATIGHEPDRFIGLPSALPRIVVSHADWEAAALGAKSAPPLYRYLFFQPAPGKKEELLQNFPGALVFGKEDRHDDAEATVAQGLLFARMGAGFAFLLGCCGVYALWRLGEHEERLQQARLQLFGARRGWLMRLAAWRMFWCCALSIPAAIPLAYCVVALARARIAYFLPYDISWPPWPGRAATACAMAALVYLGLGAFGSARGRSGRPGPLLRGEMRSPERAHGWVMLTTLALCVSGSGLGIAYWELLPALASSVLPATDGLIVLGGGPPGDEEIATVWGHLHVDGQARAMALAVCSEERNGLAIEERFARRLGVSLGADLVVGVGRERRTLRVESVAPRPGMLKFLSQIEIPCSLARASRPFRIAWHSGNAESLRAGLPAASVSLSAAEWRDRVADLAARAIFLPQLCVAYGSGVSLLLAAIAWRRLLWERRGELALWRVCGASRCEVEKRLFRAFRGGIAVSLLGGAVLAWFLAGALSRFVLGTAMWPAWWWIPLCAAVWAPMVWAVWTGILARILRERPLAILRAR